MSDTPSLRSEYERRSLARSGQGYAIAVGFFELSEAVRELQAQLARLSGNDDDGRANFGAIGFAAVRLGEKLAELTEAISERGK